LSLIAILEDTGSSDGGSSGSQQSSNNKATKEFNEVWDWADEIKKQMDNVKIPFKILGQEDIIPSGFTEISCHLIFDVKFDLTRRKAR
jgi:hypothetical protein